MADWMRVFKVAPRAVVVIVNEKREQPEIGAPYIRAELRFKGRTIIFRARQRKCVDAAFATLTHANAVEWVINMARDLQDWKPCNA